MNRSEWKWNAAIALGLFLLNAILNYNIFLPGEMPYRDSIEGGYASIAKFIANNPNPWGWNPTVYCGLPTQFTYLPGLPYLAAAVHWATGIDVPYAWRLVTAVFTCLGPVTLFLMVLYFTGSRGWALAAALGYTAFSPLYRLIEHIDGDRGFAQLPWRVQVLVKYGEGPHNAGLTILPVALIACWAAATGRKYRQVLAAAVSLAAITLIDWVAAFALAICCLLMLLTAAGSGKITGFRARRFFAAAALGYLMAAFWLTPSFIRTIAFNWPADSFGYKLRLKQILLLLFLMTALVLIRLLMAALPRHTYLCFLALSLFAFAFIPLNFYWRLRDVIPESRRYALEFEMFLILFLAEAVRLGIGHRWRIVQVAAIALALGFVWAGRKDAWSYLAKDNSKWRPVPKEQVIEYEVGRRLAERKPAGRVLVTGGTRFRVNSWFDLHQVGGTFESGLRERMPVHFVYQIRTGLGSRPGQEAHDAVPQLKAMGVEYVALHGPASREHWRDFKNPGKFEDVLETVHRNGDDVIYRAPFSSLAHLVWREELPKHPPIHGSFDALRPYAAAIDDASRPKLKVSWLASSELAIEGPVPRGMLVSVQVHHDPGWTVVQDGRPIPFERDANAFMLLRPEPSPHSRIVMSYRGTAEQKAMASVSILAWLAAAGLLLRRRKAA